MPVVEKSFARIVELIQELGPDRVLFKHGQLRAREVSLLGKLTKLKVLRLYRIQVRQEDLANLKEMLLLTRVSCGDSLDNMNGPRVVLDCSGGFPISR